jgi:hypothetical protein
MKKLLFLLLPVLFLSGCASIFDPVLLDKSFSFEGKYEITGEVFVEDDRLIILGLFWEGGVQWLDLLREAKRVYGDNSVDDVVSVSVDTETNMFLGIVTWQHIIMRGTAIRYTDGPVSVTPGAP